MKHVGETVDRIYKQEYCDVMGPKDKRLTGTNCLWLY